MNTFPLEEKVCLVFGGLGGIATASASLFLKRGAKIFATDLKDEADADIAGKFGEEAKVGYARCDVSSREQVEAAFRKCREFFDSPPDLVLNCAAAVGEQDWEKMYDVNIKGAHLVIEAAFKHMGKDGHDGGGGNGGAVINLSSTAGLTCVGDMYTVPAYTASKHAVTTLTRTFGTDFYFNRTGVRVIALAPYWVDTPLLRDGFRMFTEDEEARKAIVKAAEGKEFLKVEDVALKLVNILNAKTGSVWLIRPEQLQPFNVPDYRLPVKVGYTAANTYLPCYGQHR